MPLTSKISVICLTSALAGCATYQQRPAQIALADCAGVTGEQAVAELYSPGKIQKVEPIYREQFLARAIQPRYVAGARLTVPAEQGLNAAYLERVLSCHAASNVGDHPNDPLRAQGVTDVDVTTMGPTVRIAIFGADRAAGRAIWQRARALEERGDVSVRQISSSSPAHPAL